MPQYLIDDGTVRVIFKVYFLVLILGIAFVGGYCLKFHIQRQLLKGKAVPLTATTGWVHGPGLAKMGLQIRRLPGGWIGFLMLFATALELISEFGVAKTITSMYQRSRYTTESAMIVGQPGTSYAMYPDIVYQAFTWATGAQDASWNNQNLTGLTTTRQYGIYSIVNYNAYNYMPTEDDIMGYWSCPRITKAPVIYDQTFQGNAAQIYDQSILADLIKGGLMYDYGPPSAITNVSKVYNGLSTGPSSQLFLWTASNYTYGSAPTFTFGVETAALDSKGSKAMDVFQCSMHSTEPSNTVWGILREVNISTVINSWSGKIAGSLYSSSTSSYSYDIPQLEATFEYYLNAMIMVAGSGQKTDTPNTRKLSYGVFEIATVIPYWIIAIAIITFAFLLFMLICLVFYWLSNMTLKHAYERQGPHRVGSKEICENTPIGLLGWMSQAAAASRDAELPEGQNLRKWILSTTWHDKRLGIVKEEEHGLMGDDAQHEGAITYIREEIKGNR